MTQLSPETHAHLGWRPAAGFGFARQITLLPLATAEIARVSQVMTVALRKDAGRWQVVAVTGPVEGTNVYVTRDGKWRTSFVPALLRVYPFCLDGAGRLDLWQGYQTEPVMAEGARPFYKDGELVPLLQQTLAFLKTVQAQIDAAHQTLHRLEGAGVLKPWEIPGLKAPQSERTLTGLNAVDPVRFGALDDDVVLELFRAGDLRWLYAHLDSLHHAERFRQLAAHIVAPGIEPPRQPDKIEQAADILAAIADDLGDSEPWA